MAKLQFGPLVSVGSADSNFARVVWIFFHLPYVSENPSKLASFWGTTKSLAQSPLTVGGSQGSWKNMAEESLQQCLVESRGSETRREGSRATLSWTGRPSHWSLSRAENESHTEVHDGRWGSHRRLWLCLKIVSKGFKRALLAFIVTLDEEHENVKRTSQSSSLHFSCMFKHEIMTRCNERAVVYVSSWMFRHQLVIGIYEA